jgi:hypothetical protein
MDKTTYTIAARHNVFGIEGARQYVGTKQGAKIAAGKIAEAAGFGWSPVVRWQDSQGGWLRLVPCGGRKA